MSGQCIKCPNCILCPFPDDENRKKKWLDLVQRKNFSVTKSSRLCSTHFKLSKFVEAPGKLILKNTANPAHTTNKYQPYELIYGFPASIPHTSSRTPQPRYNYDDYVFELKQKFQESHKQSRENILLSKEKSKPTCIKVDKRGALYTGILSLQYSNAFLPENEKGLDLV
ncbi:THAP domain-containing protein 2-like, partial [Aphis craccivora]